MFQRIKKAQPVASDEAPERREPTVKELAAAVGITDRALRTCFARGCPRGPAEAIHNWRSAHVFARNGRGVEAPGLKDVAIPAEVTIDPTEACLRFGRALLEDSRSTLFRGIDRQKHRQLIGEQLAYLCDVLDDPADLADRVIDRRGLFEELGLAEQAAESFSDAGNEERPTGPKKQRHVA